jgi:hypothetical protein
MKRALFISSWVLASVVATSMALAAVGSVTNDITDSPGATLAGPDTTTSSTTSVDGSTTTSTSEAPGSTTSTTVGQGTTSTTIPDDDDDDDTTSTTTSTIPDDDTTTSTTAPPVVTETRTYQLQGGWVKVDIGEGFVDLVGAAPAPGFSMDAEHTENDGVRVKFESEDHKSELEVRWNDGKLIIEIDEEPEGDESDDH